MTCFTSYCRTIPTRSLGLRQLPILLTYLMCVAVPNTTTTAQVLRTIDFDNSIYLGPRTEGVGVSRASDSTSPTSILFTVPSAPSRYPVLAQANSGIAIAFNRNPIDGVDDQPATVASDWSIGFPSDATVPQLNMLLSSTSLRLLVDIYDFRAETGTPGVDFISLFDVENQMERARYVVPAVRPENGNVVTLDSGFGPAASAWILFVSSPDGFDIGIDNIRYYEPVPEHLGLTGSVLGLLSPFIALRYRRSAVSHAFYHC
ncbi:MAG: hypothetical protein R3E01_10435 [Pirellulaceae bacterium]